VEEPAFRPALAAAHEGGFSPRRLLQTAAVWQTSQTHVCAFSTVSAARRAYDNPHPADAGGALHGFRNRRRPQVSQADLSRLPLPASLSKSRIARRGREVPALLELRTDDSLLRTRPELEGLISAQATPRKTDGLCAHRGRAGLQAGVAAREEAGFGPLWPTSRALQNHHPPPRWHQSGLCRV